MGSRKSVQELVRDNVDWVNRLVAKILRVYPYHPYVCENDLRSAGLEALFFAAGRYEPARCPSFRGFAYRRVYGAMQQVFRETIGRQWGAFCDDSLPQPVRCDPHRPVKRAQTNFLLQSELKKLAATDRSTLIEHYCVGLSIADVAARAGRHRVSVFRARSRALAQLRKSLPSQCSAA